MNDIKALVKSWVNSSEEFSVDFDLLWRGLGYTTKGNAQRKFESAGFEKDIDFRVIKIDKSAPGGGLTHRNDYFLTTEAAKSFCMMANTTVGKQVRSYFIECERQLKQVLQTNIKSLSQKEVIELAYEALGRQVAQNNYCADKPGLRNIVEFISQPNALNAAKASVQEIAATVFGVDLEPGEVMSLGRTCATTYRTWHNAEPEKELQEINGAKRPVAVYGTEIYSTVENWLTNKGYLTTT
jgi:phage anti-repressor protein